MFSDNVRITQGVECIVIELSTENCTSKVTLTGTGDKGFSAVYKNGHAYKEARYLSSVVKIHAPAFIGALSIGSEALIQSTAALMKIDLDFYSEVK